MEFIDGTVLQRADDIFTNNSAGSLGGRSGRDHRRGWGSSARVYLACSLVPIKPVLMCRWRHLRWVAGSWSLCTRHMLMACSASCGCELCSCSHCLCLSASFWDWKQRVAHEDPRCA